MYHMERCPIAFQLRENQIIFSFFHFPEQFMDLLYIDTLPHCSCSTQFYWVPIEVVFQVLTFSFLMKTYCAFCLLLRARRISWMTFQTLMTSAFTVPLYSQTLQRHPKRSQPAKDEKKEKVNLLLLLLYYCTTLPNSYFSIELL